MAFLGSCALCRVGNTVWLDEDQDGLQDPGEPGVEGVRVEMLRPTTYGQGFYSGFTVWDSDVTDANGNYSLDLPVGTNIVKFYLPAGYQFTLPYRGDNTAKDSNVDSPVGLIGVGFSLTFFQDWDPYHTNAGKSFGLGGLNDYDAGLIAPPTPTPEILIPFPPAFPPPAAAGTPEVSVSVDTHCRSGPGSNYKLLDTVSVGEKVEVIGVFPGSEYVVVRLPSGGECWLWLRYADRTDFSEFNLPEATQPPMPTATPTPQPPTVKPSSTLTPSSTPRPIG